MENKAIIYHPPKKKKINKKGRPRKQLFNISSFIQIQNLSTCSKPLYVANNDDLLILP